MKKLLLFPAALLLLYSCVPKDQYEALQIERDYYRNKTIEADSIADLQALTTYETKDNATAEQASTIQKMEQLTATNKALNASYQSLLSRYNQLLDQNQKLLANTGQEVTGIQTTLAERTQEINRREAELRRLETELKAREATLKENEVPVITEEANPGSNKSGTVAPNSRHPLNAQQLVALKANAVQTDLNQTLDFLPAGSYAVVPAGVNRIQISLADGLLMGQSYQLRPGGVELLNRLAATFQLYPATEISVVGNAAGDDEDAQAAYEDSTDKAIAVAQHLISAGISGRHVTAGSKGFYAPVADASTDQGRMANRRLDIFVTITE